MAAVGHFFHGLGTVLKWLLIIGALIVVVVIIAAIVNLGNAANKSENSAAQVTPAKYAQIHTGQSQAAVRGILGSPENTDTTKIQGLGHSDCWYYGVLAKQTTQICFRGDVVNYKAQYGSK